MQEFKCPLCGSGKIESKNEGGMYRCVHCGSMFRDEFVNEQLETVKNALGGIMSAVKEEEIANARYNLWDAAHEEFIDADKILSDCRTLKLLLPKDFLANFYELACRKDVKKLNRFLSEIDPEQHSGYLDCVLEFSLKALKKQSVLPLNDLVSRAFEGRDVERFAFWNAKLQREAKKIESGIYDPSETRDVFVAYKSEDMRSVEELVEYLEEVEGLRCFVAARNLQHGKIGDYESALQTAMDSCRSVVFVSTALSRRQGDAREKELKYIRDCDFLSGPVSYRRQNDYKRLPKEYKKPRAEYVKEPYTGAAAENFCKEFFDGYERCYTKEDVAARLFGFFDGCVPESASESASEIAPTAAPRRKPLRWNKDEFEIAGTTLVRYKGKGGEVIVPNGVEKIAARAFEREINVGSVTLPESLEEIGEYAFTECRALRSIFIPENVQRIGKCAFGKCSALELMQVDNYNTRYKSSKSCILTSDGETLIAGCKKSVIPYGVKIIAPHAFDDCTELRSVEIPATVEEIGEHAFDDCRSLTDLYLPQGVKKIGNRAFENCARLKTVKLPASVEEISESAFSWCESLARITADGASEHFMTVDHMLLTKDGKVLVAGNRDAEKCVVPKGVVKIARGAFNRSKALKILKLPDSLEEIGDLAFCFCTALKAVKFPPELKSIGKGAFGRCDSLVSVTLPASVATVGDNAFGECSALTVYCRTDEEPYGWSVNWANGCRVVLGYKGLTK